MIQSINPASLEVIAAYEEHSEEEVENILERAKDAQIGWEGSSMSDRTSVMNKVAHLLEEKKASLSKMMTSEMGKPIKEARAEVDKCIWVCKYYAEHAESFLADEHIATEGRESFIAYRPLGVLLAVMPWNFPLWQVFRFAVPALMAGNAIVLKHASNTTGCALAIEALFHESGIPEDVFRSLKINRDKVSSIIQNPIVKGVTLTGSTGAGKAIAEEAGRQLKKTVLELGGSDPYIILEDADLDIALEACVTSRMINSGQSCIAAKRFIVHQAVYNDFIERFTDKVKAIKMGDPMDEDMDIGPQAREDLRDDLHEQVQKSISAGAECLTGGHIPDQKGAWYPPTVLIDVRKGSPAYDEELFGPVAAIIRAEDEDHALEIANDTVFGLGAAVFTRDLQRGRYIASTRLAAGCCFVNEFVKSDPRLPFGGIKQSGYGRELSFLGIREFVNAKTVYIK